LSLCRPRRSIRQKTFVDATPNQEPRDRRGYDAQKNQPGFSLAAFVGQYSRPPSEP